MIISFSSKISSVGISFFKSQKKLFNAFVNKVAKEFSDSIFKSSIILLVSAISWFKTFCWVYVVSAISSSIKEGNISVLIQQLKIISLVTLSYVSIK